MPVPRGFIPDSPIGFVSTPAESTRGNVAVNAALPRANYTPEWLQQTIPPAAGLLAALGSDLLTSGGAAPSNMSVALATQAAARAALARVLAGGLGYGAGQAGANMLPGAKPKSIARGVMTGALLEAPGAAGSALAPGFANKAMKSGMKMMPTAGEKWSRWIAGNETPEEAAIRMRISSSGSALKAKNAAEQRTLLGIDQADKAGLTVTARDLASGALAQARSKARRKLTALEQAKIIDETAQMADELLNHAAMGTSVRNVPPGVSASSVPFTMGQAYDIKQAAQALSKNRYTGAPTNLAANPNAVMLLGTSAKQAVANRAGVGVSTSETAKAIRLGEAMKRAEGRQRASVPQQTLATLGGAASALAMPGSGAERALAGLAGGYLSHLAGSPEAMRAYAMILSHPAYNMAVSHGPMAGAALAPLLQQLMQGRSGAQPRERE